MLGEESSPSGAPTLTETAGQSIAAYRIGEKLRALRARQKLSLVELGKLTGLSPSMLSQLENGKLIPTLPTLTRIALAFGAGLDSFFNGIESSKSFALLKKQDVPALDGHPESADPNSFFASPLFTARDNPMRIFTAQFPPDEAHSNPHSHDGAEFLHLISGQLEIRTATGLHRLEAGDSCYFDSSEAHSYRCASASQATAIAVIAPSRTPY